MNSLVKQKRVCRFLRTRFYNILDIMLLLSISIAVIVFILCPIFSVIKKSIFIDGSFTLKLYTNIFMKNGRLLVNSLFVAVLTTMLSTFLAISISIYACFTSKKNMNRIYALLMMSMISPPFVGSLAYIQLFGKRGFITHDILKLTINPYGWQGIVLMESLSMTALSSLMLIAIIKNIDKRTLNASSDLGAPRTYTIFSVLLPMMSPGIIVCSLLTFIRSLSDFGTPMTIGGAFNVLATEIYMRVIAYGDLNMSAAMNVLLLIPALIIFIIYRSVMKRYNTISISTDSKGSAGDEFILEKGVFRGILKLITFFYLFMMVSQYITIFISSITKYNKGKLYFTLETVRQLKEYGFSAFGRSVIYALIAGILGTLLGMLISYYCERRKFFGMKAIDFISTLPYTIPGTFFGIGYILAFNKSPLKLTGTALIVVLNCIFKQLPLTTKIASANLSQINRDIDSSAKDLGASPFHILKDMIIPNMKSSFTTGFINNFSSTMTTVGSIIFLIYPGQKVATIMLFDAINSGDTAMGSLIASILIIIILSVNIIFSKVIMGGRNVFRAKKSIQKI